MIKALKEERGIEKMAVHNAGQTRSGSGTPIFGASTPEGGSGDESTSAAARARAHRDKLLAFQRDNAQRTRVHDEAADYDTTLTPGATQWMSPLQRAAALKKQQKYIRELEEANKPEWEKKRTVLSMSIKNGKLVKNYGKSQAATAVLEAEDDKTDDYAVEEQLLDLGTGGKQGAFSNNPLLASGKLIRPIWKPADGGDGSGGEGKGRGRTRPSVWRRVQDEDNDNEQWILDGGLHGYNTETRMMEDGSQQECG
jgi:hexokinase